MNDQWLIKGFIDGDSRAFGILVARWQPQIHRFALHFLADADDAAEITQKTFIKAYHKLETLEDTAKFSAWIYRIAKNLCLDELKRPARRNSTPFESQKKNFSAEASEAPDIILEHKDTARLLHRALMQLPPEQRIVVIMKEYEGFTFSEIAEILEEPENTVKSRMYYGLKKLKEIFAKWNINKEVFKND